jgi:hypothetical protein
MGTPALLNFRIRTAGPRVNGSAKPCWFRKRSQRMRVHASLHSL